MCSDDETICPTLGETRSEEMEKPRMGAVCRSRETIEMDGCQMSMIVEYDLWAVILAEED